MNRAQNHLTWKGVQAGYPRFEWATGFCVCSYGAMQLRKQAFTVSSTIT